jgi:hypothetical protein
MADPIVTWYVDDAGACKIFMHQGDTLRVFASPTVAAAEATIASVAIDAFKMSQDEARAFAAGAVADQVKVVTPPADLSAHMELLQDELTDSQAELAAANAKLASYEPHNPPEEETDGAAPVPVPVTGAAAGEGMTDSSGHNLPGGRYAPSPVT